ncbi:hypothetical protein [Wolbachia endosymbiont (group A) of Udea olivalis]|uniref:hypothetical protein n=1 Tax=Wolbachia endosymbiont (group A) of Udea olivalis TaxID=3066183 RepID=UPI00313305C3
MLRYRAQLYERCSLGAIPTSGMSSQCPDTGIQLLCNLIKNVCFSVRQLPLAHQLSYKQNFWIPVSSTGMTPFAVQFRGCPQTKKYVVYEDRIGGKK